MPAEINFGDTCDLIGCRCVSSAPSTSVDGEIDVRFELPARNGGRPIGLACKLSQIALSNIKLHSAESIAALDEEDRIAQEAEKVDAKSKGAHPRLLPTWRERNNV